MINLTFFVSLLLVNWQKILPVKLYFFSNFQLNLFLATCSLRFYLKKCWKSIRTLSYLCQNYISFQIFSFFFSHKRRTKTTQWPQTKLNMVLQPKCISSVFEWFRSWMCFRCLFVCALLRIFHTLFEIDQKQKVKKWPQKLDQIWKVTKVFSFCSSSVRT